MLAIVTGGCHGLGKCFSLELLNRGYDVCVGKIPNGEVDFVALKDGKIHAFSFTVLVLLIIMRIQEADIR